MVDVLSLFRLNSVGGSVQNAHRTPNYYRVIVVEDRTGPAERRYQATQICVEPIKATTGGFT